MRILHVVAQLGTYGAERFVSLLVSNDTRAGMCQGVLTVRSSSREATEGLGVTVLDAARLGRYDVGFLPRMVRLIRKYRPDIVHTHTHVGKYWGRLASIVAGVRLIVHTEHNGFFGASTLFRPINSLLLRYTDAIVAFSPSHRDYLIAEEGIAYERISIIPNGITLREPAAESNRMLARATLGVGDHDRVLLHIARFAPAKNQQLAIEALAALDERHRLFFIGDGTDRPALEMLSRERGVDARISFLGYRPDAATFLAGADTLIVTSKIEGMPLTVMEAMMTGVPIVSTPWRGAAEMLGDGAYGQLTADFMPATFASAIRSTLDEPNSTRERAARAVEFARTEFDICTAVDRHAALYHRLSSVNATAKRRIIADRS